MLTFSDPASQQTLNETSELDELLAFAKSLTIEEEETLFHLMNTDENEGVGGNTTSDAVSDEQLQSWEVEWESSDEILAPEKMIEEKKSNDEQSKNNEIDLQNAEKTSILSATIAKLQKDKATLKKFINSVSAYLEDLKNDPNKSEDYAKLINKILRSKSNKLITYPPCWEHITTQFVSLKGEPQEEKAYAALIDSIIISRSLPLINYCLNDIVIYFEKLSLDSSEEGKKEFVNLVDKILASYRVRLIEACADGIVIQLERLQENTSKKGEKALAAFIDRILATECAELMENQVYLIAFTKRLKTLIEKAKEDQNELELFLNKLFSCPCSKLIRHCMPIIVSWLETLKNDTSTQGKENFEKIINKILVNQCDTLIQHELCWNFILTQLEKLQAESSQEKEKLEVLLNNILGSHYSNLIKHPSCLKAIIGLLNILKQDKSKEGKEKYEKFLKSILSCQCSELIKACQKEIIEQLNFLYRDTKIFNDYIDRILSSYCSDLINHPTCIEAIYNRLKELEGKKELKLTAFLNRILSNHCPALIEKCEDIIYHFLSSLQQKTIPWKEFLYKIITSENPKLIERCKEQIDICLEWLKNSKESQKDYTKLLIKILTTQRRVVIEVYTKEIIEHSLKLKEEFLKNNKDKNYGKFLLKIMSSQDIDLIKKMAREIIAYCHHKLDIDFLKKLTYIRNKKIVNSLLKKCLQKYTPTQLDEIKKSGKKLQSYVDALYPNKVLERDDPATGSPTVRLNNKASRGSWFSCLPNPNDLPDNDNYESKPLPLNGVVFHTLQGAVKANKEFMKVSKLRGKDEFKITIINMTSYKEWYKTKNDQSTNTKNTRKQLKRKKPYTRGCVWFDCLPDPQLFLDKNSKKKLILPLNGANIKTLQPNINKLNNANNAKIVTVRNQKDNKFKIRIYNVDVYSAWYADFKENKKPPSKKGRVVQVTVASDTERSSSPMTEKDNDLSESLSKQAETIVATSSPQQSPTFVAASVDIEELNREDETLMIQQPLQAMETSSEEQDQIVIPNSFAELLESNDLMDVNVDDNFSEHSNPNIPVTEHQSPQLMHNSQSTVSLDERAELRIGAPTISGPLETVDNDASYTVQDSQTASSVRTPNSISIPDPRIDAIVSHLETLKQRNTEEGKRSFATLAHKILSCGSLELIKRCQTIISSQLEIYQISSDEEDQENFLRLIDKILSSDSPELIKACFSIVFNSLESLQNDLSEEGEKKLFWFICKILDCKCQELIKLCRHLIINYHKSLTVNTTATREKLPDIIIDKMLHSNCPELVASYRILSGSKKTRKNNAKSKPKPKSKKSLPPWFACFPEPRLFIQDGADSYCICRLNGHRIEALRRYVNKEKEKNGIIKILKIYRKDEFRIVIDDIGIYRQWYFRKVGIPDPQQEMDIEEAESLTTNSPDFDMVDNLPEDSFQEDFLTLEDRETGFTFGSMRGSSTLARPEDSLPRSLLDADGNWCDFSSGPSSLSSDTMSMESLQSIIQNLLLPEDVVDAIIDSYLEEFHLQENNGERTELTVQSGLQEYSNETGPVMDIDIHHQPAGQPFQAVSSPRWINSLSMEENISSDPVYTPRLYAENYSTSGLFRTSSQQAQSLETPPSLGIKKPSDSYKKFLQILSQIAIQDYVSANHSINNLVLDGNLFCLVLRAMVNNQRGQYDNAISDITEFLQLTENGKKGYPGISFEELQTIILIAQNHLEMAKSKQSQNQLRNSMSL